MPDAKTYTQQDLDAAIAAAVEPLKGEITKMKTDAEQQAFNQRLADAKTVVTGLVNEGKLLPASTVGLVEFLASLPSGAESVFEFSQGEGATAETKKVQPYEFMIGHLKQLPKAVRLGRREDGGDAQPLDVGNSKAIAAKAQEYQSSESAKGRDISIAQAVMHVSKTGEQE